MGETASEITDQKKPVEAPPESESAKSTTRKKSGWGLTISLITLVIALVKVGVLVGHPKPDFQIDPVPVSVPDFLSDADPASDIAPDFGDNSTAYCEKMRQMVRQTLEDQGEQPPGQIDNVMHIMAPQCE